MTRVIIWLQVYNGLKMIEELKPRERNGNRKRIQRIKEIDEEAERREQHLKRQKDEQRLIELREREKGGKIRR